MKPNRRYLLVGTVLCVYVSIVSAQTQKNYEIQDLGTLGGSSSNANAINDKSEVTGDAVLTGDTASHAFIWTKGRMRDLDAPGTFSSGRSINNSGDVVGWINDSTCCRLSRAFLYRDEKVTLLETLGGTQSRALAINNSGEIVGWSFTVADADLHAVLYKKGRLTDLGLPGFESIAYGISDSGLTTGQATSIENPLGFPFLYKHENVVPLFGSSGAQGRGFAINNKGEVAGDAPVGTGFESHAFLCQGIGVPRVLSS